ncbi:anthranilate synthase component I [Bacillus sp. FJAT-45066]|uniref:anthranilate synthase component I n=1 Tax=Bacillus sp. FJAT-45066 TaxID=2011010 RepID=UPI000BB77ABB
MLSLTSFLQHSQEYEIIPVFENFLSDRMTPIEIFESLKKEAVYLLESKDDKSAWSNYSFIGLEPMFTIEGSEVISLKDMKGKIIFQSTSLSAIFQALTDIFKIKTVKDLNLPFTGGAVGYIAYDHIQFIDKVPLKKRNRNDHTVQLYICETLLVMDHKKNNTSIIHYVQLSGKETADQKKLHYEKGKSKLKTLIQQIHQSVNDKKEIPSTLDKRSIKKYLPVASSYTKERYCNDVKKIQEYIHQGDIFQCVLSQRFTVKSNIQAFDVYRVLRNTNPSPYLFYIKLKDSELIGSSPERLIQVKNGELEIHPIAGTRRRGNTTEEDEKLKESLLQDEKEAAEHIMLVDLARNDIGRVATYGSVKMTRLREIVYFSEVMHIISVVNGQLDVSKSPMDALLAAFPAGTVSGAPKVRAMQIIEELEPIARNKYAGAVCYLSFDGNIDSCITIRTIEKQHDNFHIQAGAGVVADSIPELEWEETKNKAKALLHAIQMAHNIFSEKGVLAND